MRDDSNTEPLEETTATRAAYLAASRAASESAFENSRCCIRRLRTIDVSGKKCERNRNVSASRRPTNRSNRRYPFHHRVPPMGADDLLKPGPPIFRCPNTGKPDRGALAKIANGSAQDSPWRRGWRHCPLRGPSGASRALIRASLAIWSSACQNRYSPIVAQNEATTGLATAAGPDSPCRIGRGNRGF